MQLFCKRILSFSKQSNKNKVKQQLNKKKKKSDEILYNPYQALHLLRAQALGNFQESVVCSIRLNVDPRHGDQLVRGTCRMPFTLGNNKKLAIITSDPALQSKCLEAGADLVITDEIVNSIKNGGKIEFDSLFSTPECVQQLKPAARWLGPAGLMPNLKLGTIVQSDQLEQLVKDSKKGVVTFRVNIQGIINAPLGKLGLSDDQQLLSNFKTFMDMLVDKKPEKVKSKYFQSVVFKTTQGPPVRLKLEYVDPRNKACLINEF